MPNVSVQAPPNLQYRFPLNVAHTTTANILNSEMACYQMWYISATQNTSSQPQGQLLTQEKQDTMQAHIKKLPHHLDTTSV